MSIHLARMLTTENKRLKSALLAVEEWWLTQGKEGQLGAPWCIFAVREALNPSAALSEQEGKPCDCGSVEFGAGAHWPSGRFGKVTCSSCGSEQEGK